MVTVWYQPPPGGPRTHLNRGAYYVENSRTPALISKMTKARPITVIFPAVAVFAALCYVPLSKYPLPRTSHTDCNNFILKQELTTILASIISK